MQVEKFRNKLIEMIAKYQVIDDRVIAEFAKQETDLETRTLFAKGLNVSAWLALAPYVVMNLNAEQFLIDGIRSGGSEELLAALQLQTTAELQQLLPKIEIKFNADRQILDFILAQLTMLPNRAELLNQMYVEAQFADGGRGPKITALSHPTPESASTLLKDNEYIYSAAREKHSVPSKNSSTALLTNKHNACPLVVGVSADADTAFAWHVSHSHVFSSDSGKIESVRVPRNFPNDAKNMQFLVMGLSEANISKALPVSVHNAKIVRLPGDLFIEPIATFRQAAEMSVGADGWHTKWKGKSTEPASYDSTYYPKSDTLILWGENNDKQKCAWFMHGAVRDEADKQWQMVVMGTEVNPTLYWEKFLHAYYTDANVSDIVSEDKLMDKFAASPQQREIAAPRRGSGMKV
jgi:hypothetical protein